MAAGILMAQRADACNCKPARSISDSLRMVDAGASSESQAPSVPQGRPLDLSFRLRLSALRAIRRQLKGQLEAVQGGSPDDDEELASKAAPGSGTYMALVGFMPPAALHLAFSKHVRKPQITVRPPCSTTP